MPRLLACLVLLLAGWTSCAAAQGCRQALALGLDVSLSVDRFEFTLQRSGLAAALTDPAVVAALLPSAGGHVELAVFEWTSRYSQALLADWTVIDGPATLAALADTLRTAPQASRTGRTAIGGAMLYGRDLLHRRRACGRLTLDLSGDGRNNTGIPPEDVRDRMAASGMTVNALVIDPSADPAGLLAGYFRNNVIVGATAFVETVADFDGYRDGITRKLLRELTPALSWSAPPPSARLARAGRLPAK